MGVDSDELVHTAIVLGDDGKYRNMEQANFWSALIFNPDISDEKFERIMDLIDYSATKEGQLLINMGFEGKDWKYDENNELVSLLPEGPFAKTNIRHVSKVCTCWVTTSVW